MIPADPAAVPDQTAGDAAAQPAGKAVRSPMADLLYPYVCAGCGAVMTHAKKCKPGCDSAEAAPAPSVRVADLVAFLSPHYVNRTMVVDQAAELSDTERARHLAVLEFIDMLAQEIGVDPADWFPDEDPNS